MTINEKSGNALHAKQQFEEQERIRQLKQRQQDHINGQLQSIRRMANTPEFVSSYYQTVQGNHFSKVTSTL